MNSWAMYPVLVGFLMLSYFVLRWVQWLTTHHSLPKLGEGEWDPMVAIYSWSTENKFKTEFQALKSKSGSHPDVTPVQLAKALMRRAMLDVDKVIEMSEQKPRLQNLLRSGFVGEDVQVSTIPCPLWNLFLKTETMMELELKEVMTEASALKPNWGENIFAQARQLLLAEKQREAEVEKIREAQEDRMRIQMVSDREKDEWSAQINAELLRKQEQEKQRRIIDPGTETNGRKKSKKKQ